jgi:hypothetical protein
MSRWITALSLIAVGISIGDSGTLAAGAASYGVAGEVTSDSLSQSAQPQPAQWVPWRSPPEQPQQPVEVPQPVQVPVQLPKSIKAVRDRHNVAHHPKAADSKAPPIKAPPPLPPALSTDAASSGKDEAVTTGEAEPVLKPHTVPTIRFLAPGAAPPQEPRAEVSSTQTASTQTAAGPAALDAGGLDADNAAALLSVLTRHYLDDKHDDTQESAAWWSMLPAPLTTVELLMLLGACGCVAIGVYGLVALRARRQDPPAVEQGAVFRARRAPAAVAPSIWARYSESVKPADSLERNRFRLNRDFALRPRGLVRKVCNFSGSCSNPEAPPGTVRRIAGRRTSGRLRQSSSG